MCVGVGVGGGVAVVVRAELVGLYQKRHEISLYLAAADLAQLIGGQVLEVVEGARDLVAGETLAAEVLQAFRIERRAFAQDDTSHDVLGAVVSWRPTTAALTTSGC